MNDPLDFPAPPPLTRGLDNPDHANWNPEDYVPSTYLMNPETETLIRGRQLEVGMRVLAEDSWMRSDPLRKQRHIDGTARGEGWSWTSYDEERLRINARWCVIVDMETTKMADGGTLVKFIGRYDDGTMHSRTLNESWCWYVKKEGFYE